MIGLKEEEIVFYFLLQKIRNINVLKKRKKYMEVMMSIFSDLEMDLIYWYVNKISYCNLGKAYELIEGMKWDTKEAREYLGGAK